MRPKMILLFVSFFALFMLMQGCIVVGPRHPRRCYTDARGRTHCKVVHHRRGHARGHRR